MAYTTSMEAMVTRNVNEISPPARRTLEDLLGRQLEANQQVFLMVLSPSHKPDAETRRQAAESIRRTLSQVDRHVAAHGISGEQVDAAVDEAMEHVRPRSN